MNALTILVDEHRVILQVLDCLERIARKAREEGTLDVGPAREAVAFFRTFADACHHGKEEEILFPFLERVKGFSLESGPTAVMRAEHVEGRACVRRMDKAVEAADRGEAESAGRYAEAAQAYLRLLRDHIGKEDHCLFRNVGFMLSPEDHRAILSDYRRVGAALEPGSHRRMLAIADRLADQYGVPRVSFAEGAV